MFREIAANAPYYAIAVLVALGLKAGYSIANSDGLRWILAPTAWLTALATRIEFDYVAGEGYLNAGHDILIAPACAGVNFLIICFCMLTFELVHRVKVPRAKLVMLVSFLLASYAATVLINATRIVVSIHSFGPSMPSTWLAPETLHRIEGVAIYFLALCVVNWVSETIAQRVSAYDRNETRSESIDPARDSALRSPREGRFGHMLLMKMDSRCENATRIQRCGPTNPHKRTTLLVPLFCYLLITLGIPLLRAPSRIANHSFVEHSVVVLVIPILIVLALSAIRRGCIWCHARRLP